MNTKIEKLKKELHREITENILPYWMNRMVDIHQGGFFGRIDGQENLIENAPKGAILNARILWTFSAAYRNLKNPVYLEIANYTRDYVLSHFFDPLYEGTYWLLHANGSVADPRKQIYSQAFFIYALSEYYRINPDEAILNHARRLFELIETHSFDPEYNGYREAFSRDWSALDDVRLSDKDANEQKTMNTHLHVLEAYTNLLRIWDDELLKKQLRNLIRIFLDRIINPKTHHLDLFFDEHWLCKSSRISFGHDIEASWLLVEAAKLLGDQELIKEVEYQSILIAQAASEGILADGSLINEFNYQTGRFDSNRDWWPQAEAIVGFWNIYQLTGDDRFQKRALSNWDFIRQRLIDREHGEWFGSISRDGRICKEEDKAGFWKCPYHNSRMCMEILERIGG